MNSCWTITQNLNGPGPVRVSSEPESAVNAKVVDGSDGALPGPIGGNNPYLVGWQTCWFEIAMEWPIILILKHMIFLLLYLPPSLLPR